MNETNNHEAVRRFSEILIQVGNTPISKRRWIDYRNLAQAAEAAGDTERAAAYRRTEKAERELEMEGFGR